MEITTQIEDGVVTAIPTSSRLDAAAATPFKGALIDLLNQGHTKIVLDLAPIQFMDSSGLGAIVAVARSLRSNGSIALSSVSPKLTPIFKLTRLGTVIPIFPDAAAARASLMK